MQNRGEVHMFYLARKWEKFGDILAEEKWTLLWLMNSNMVKPEQFDHLHLVYHFTVPLSIFYRYYIGRCSLELTQLVPLPCSRGKSTCYSVDCIIFLSTFLWLDVTRMSMSTVSFSRVCSVYL